MTPTPTSNSLLWYAQYWAVRVPESTNNTTPSLPGPEDDPAVRRASRRATEGYGGQSATRYALGALLGVAGQSEWRNRQTRQLEGLVPARAWGFKSPLRHDFGG